MIKEKNHSPKSSRSSTNTKKAALGRGRSELGCRNDLWCIYGSNRGKMVKITLIRLSTTGPQHCTYNTMAFLSSVQRHGILIHNATRFLTTMCNFRKMNITWVIDLQMRCLYIHWKSNSMIYNFSVYYKA